jgi:hypothetical protein
MVFFPGMGISITLPGGPPPYGSLSTAGAGCDTSVTDDPTPNYMDFYPTLSVGSEHYWRYLYILMTAGGTYVTGAPTVNGTPMTKVTEAGYGFHLKAFCIQISTGTTVDVDLTTMSSLPSNYTAHVVYSPYNPFSSNYTSTYSANSNKSFSVGARTVTMAHAYGASDTSNYTWTSMTERCHAMRDGGYWDYYEEAYWVPVHGLVESASLVHSSATTVNARFNASYGGSGFVINID